MFPFDVNVVIRILDDSETELEYNLVLGKTTES